MIVVTSAAYLKRIDKVTILHPFTDKYYSSFVLKILYKIFKNTVLSSLFYNKNLLLPDNQTIIVCDDFSTKRFLRWLSKKNKSSRLIFWYWQYEKTTFSIKKIPNEYEKWTYCFTDSLKFNIRYSQTFFPNQEAIERASSFEKEDCQYDFCFIGKSKGRKKEILNLSKKLKKMGYSVLIYFSKSHRMGFSRKNKKLSYFDYLIFQKKARCIIDYCVSPYTGLSLRSLEAVAFGKKILTNCEEIKKYSFYNPNDVLIYKDNAICKDDIEKLFSTSPKKIDVNSFIKEFSFSTWIERFDK